MTVTEMALRIACSALAGALLGLERDVRRRPAGLRTHTLVACGAALFVLAGSQGFEATAGPRGFDPSRVAAQVVSGLGFVGAGAIIRDGTDVKGLTTASTIWASGALGLAYALGQYTMATFTLVVMMVVLVGFRYLRRFTGNIGRVSVDLKFSYLTGHGTLAPILNGLEELGAETSQISIQDAAADDVIGVEDSREQATTREVVVETLCERSKLDKVAAFVEELQDRPEVFTIEVNGD